MGETGIPDHDLSGWTKDRTTTAIISKISNSGDIRPVNFPQSRTDKNPSEIVGVRECQYITVSRKRVLVGLNGLG